MRLACAALVVLTVAAGIREAGAQTEAPSPPPRAPNSEAMYAFLLARRAEARDDVKEAQAALDKAIALDPLSAELRAELAGFFARQNRAEDAVTAAERAVGLDPGSEEGHRILGLVYAAWADGTVGGPAGGGTDAWRAKAIEHLAKIQSGPTMATDLGLQMTLARQLLAADQPARAVPLLERVLSQTGPAVEPLALLADAHRSLGQFDRAAEALEQAAAANPRYFLALGDLYEQQRRWEDAATAYEKGASSMRSPGRELQLRRAGALLNIPDAAGAKRAAVLLTEITKVNPKDTMALYLLARAYQQLGDGDASERTARSLLTVEPGNLSALGVLAGVYRQRYDFASIVVLLAPLQQDAAVPTGARAGEAVRLLAELGGAQQQVGDTAGAVRTFERARQVMPDSLPVLAALAQAHLQAGQYGEALRMARNARATSGGDLALLRVEALADVRAGRPAEAVAFLERSVAGRRDDPATALVLAEVYQEAKRHDDAIRVVSALAAKAPADDELAFRLAAAYENGDRVPEAEQTFRAILARDPLHANALNYLGYMLADRGTRASEGLAFIDRALAAEPNNPSFLDSRGWALFKLGRAADAEEPLRRAATALGGSSVIQSHYADVLTALGKREAAAAALERALAGDGQDIDRAQLERRLRQLGRRPQ